MTKTPAIVDFMRQYEMQIAAALPAHMSVMRMQRLVLTEVRKNTALLKCDPVSLFGAVIQCAQLGLEPDTGLGHAYFVPYGKEVNLIIGYRGMIDLARRSGEIKRVRARVVYTKDDFEFEYGLHEDIQHRPNRHGEPGQVTHVYAVAVFVEGDTQFDVMTKDDINKIRARSAASKEGPWATDYEEMAKKTVVRRLFKYLPTSIEMRSAVALDDSAERGEQDTRAWLDADYTLIDQTPATKTDRVKKTMAGDDGKPSEGDVFKALHKATTREQLNEALALSSVITDKRKKEFSDLAKEKHVAINEKQGGDAK